MERLGVHYVAEPRTRRRYDPDEHLSRRHLAGKHNQKDHGHGHAAAGAGTHRATTRELDDKVDQLQAKDPEKYWMVSKTHEGAKAYAINADDGSRKGYVALYEHDGGKTVEIGTLVAEPGSRGVVADAMKATDDLYPNAKQKLDCFDGHLPTIYAKHGFVETGRVKWDDQYAPDVWKPEYGRPDVVFMERAPAAERRSRVNGASHQYDARHLPGKHNQKDHGQGGGAAVLDRPLPRRLTDEQYAAILPGPGQTKAKALRALKSTPEGQELLDAALLWQDDMSAVSTMQKNFVARSQGKKLTKNADERVTALMDGIRNSPVSPPLYRGARMPKGFDPQTALKPGTSFTLPPSSFSSSERIGRGFAKQKVRRETVPVVYRVKAARGVPVEVFGHSSYKNEKEWISAGQFVVTAVSKGRDGVYAVDVDHVAMFSW